MSIPLGQSSRSGSSCLPGSGVGTPMLPYLALHRIRHSWLPLSPMAPVVSYTAISPLRNAKAMLRKVSLQARFWRCAVCFCGAGSALLQLPVRKYPAHGVRTFLCTQKAQQTSFTPALKHHSICSLQIFPQNQSLRILSQIT